MRGGPQAFRCDAGKPSKAYANLGRSFPSEALPIPDSNGNSDTRITFVAVGPGNPDMLTLQGRQALQDADLVLGFNTVLNVVRPLLDHAEVCPMSYRDQEQVLEYAEEQVRQGKKCVVCCWGDLNVSARELLERVQRRADRVDLVPGISSVQVAMARTGIFLEDSVFLTLHKRAATGQSHGEPVEPLEELAHYISEGRRHVILLPRPFDLMPAGIASGLLELGVRDDVDVRVYQRLTFDDEQCWRGTLVECSRITDEFSDLSIMVFLTGQSPIHSTLPPGEG